MAKHLGEHRMPLTLCSRKVAKPISVSADVVFGFWEARHASAVDVNKLLLCADGLRYRNVLVLIAATGLRRGETLALHWSNVASTLGCWWSGPPWGRVGGKLGDHRTEHGPLAANRADRPPWVAMLRAHRADQAAERLSAANQWQDHGLVFASEFGTPVDPRNILRTIQIAAQKAGSDIGVHTLRHSRGLA